MELSGLWRTGPRCSVCRLRLSSFHRPPATWAGILDPTGLEGLLIHIKNRQPEILHNRKIANGKGKNFSGQRAIHMMKLKPHNGTTLHLAFYQNNPIFKNQKPIWLEFFLFPASILVLEKDITSEALGEFRRKLLLDLSLIDRPPAQNHQAFLALRPAEGQANFLRCYDRR